MELSWLILLKKVLFAKSLVWWLVSGFYFWLIIFAVLKGVESDPSLLELENAIKEISPYPNLSLNMHFLFGCLALGGIMNLVVFELSLPLLKAITEATEAGLGGKYKGISVILKVFLIPFDFLKAVINKTTDIITDIAKTNPKLPLEDGF